MVRIFASVLALALSTAVFAAPMPDMHAEPAPAEAATTSSVMHDATTTAAMGHATTTAMVHDATTTPAAVHDTTSTTAAAHATTTAAVHDTTTAAAHETTTTAAAHTTAAPSYGSGYANWGTDLNSCVQMCQAKFGAPSAGTPPPTTTAAPEAPAAGTGATHTVIVAPTKGVLRYVPFAVNASVGDTVRFMWGAGPHTVTKSSALTVCNRTADVSSFASGQQNASFVFDQVVNSTEPTFFYCAVATHCQKGMFGIINPPNAAAGAASSVGAMMSTWTSQNPDLAKMQSAVDDLTKGTPAYGWASNLDVANIPTEAHQSLVENVFYTRMFYAANTGASEGATRPDGQPITIPADVQNLLTNPSPSVGAPAANAPSGTPTGTSTGLLSEAFAVLADLKCNVVAAEVWTHNSRMASVVLITDEATGLPIDNPDRLAKIKQLLLYVLKGDRDKRGANTAVSVGSTHKERRLHQMMYADRDYDMDDTDCMSTSDRSKLLVTVEKCADKGYTAVNLTCPDRPKLLFDTVCTLTDMQYVVYHGTVIAEGPEAYQEYYIRHTDGCPISSEAERQRVIHCLEAAIKRRTSEGIRLELCGEDRIGLLSDVTRIFRENGLSVTRAEVTTRGSQAVNAFYVTDASGNAVKSETIEAVRKEIGLTMLHVKDDAYSKSPTQESGKFSLGNLFRTRSEKFLYNLGLIKSCS